MILFLSHSSPLALTTLILLYRYLSSYECGWFAILILLLWLSLGRHAERCINRTYERTMLDNTRAHRRDSKRSQIHIHAQPLSLWIQIIYDALCPLVIQRKVFLPEWNKHSLKTIVNDIQHTRSIDNREQRFLFHAKDDQRAGDRILPTTKPVSPSLKVLLCCMVGLGSFTAVSPHFIQNFCTVFFGSIGMVSYCFLRRLGTSINDFQNSDFTPLLLSTRRA